MEEIDTKYAASASAVVKSSLGFDQSNSDDSVLEIEPPIKSPPPVVALSPTPEDVTFTDTVVSDPLSIVNSKELRFRDPDIICIGIPMPPHNSTPKIIDIVTNNNSWTLKPQPSLKKEKDVIVISDSSSECTSPSPKRKRKIISSFKSNEIVMEQTSLEIGLINKKKNTKKRKKPKVNLMAMKTDIELNILNGNLSISKVAHKSRISNEISYSEVMGLDSTQNQRDNALSLPSQGHYTWAPKSWTKEMKQFYLDPRIEHRDITLEDVKNRIPENSIWPLHPDDLVLNNNKNRNRYFNPMANIRCYKCKQTGHIVSACPRQNALPVCSTCGLQGHKDCHCPNAMCLNCGQKSLFTTANCSRCRGRFNGSKCMLCGSSNHSLTKCKNYEAVSRVCVKSTQQSPAVMCRCCGGNGHTYDDCLERDNSAMCQTTNHSNQATKRKANLDTIEQTQQNCNYSGKISHLDSICPRNVIVKHTPMPAAVDAHKYAAPYKSAALGNPSCQMSSAAMDGTLCSPPVNTVLKSLATARVETIKSQDGTQPYFPLVTDSLPQNLKLSTGSSASPCCLPPPTLDTHTKSPQSLEVKLAQSYLTASTIASSEAGAFLKLEQQILLEESISPEMGSMKKKKTCKEGQSSVTATPTKVLLAPEATITNHPKASPHYLSLVPSPEGSVGFANDDIQLPAPNPLKSDAEESEMDPELFNTLHLPQFRCDLLWQIKRAVKKISSDSSCVVQNYAFVLRNEVLFDVPLHELFNKHKQFLSCLQYLSIFFVAYLGFNGGHHHLAALKHCYKEVNKCCDFVIDCELHAQIKYHYSRLFDGHLTLKKLKNIVKKYICHNPDTQLAKDLKVL